MSEEMDFAMFWMRLCVCRCDRGLDIGSKAIEACSDEEDSMPFRGPLWAQTATGCFYYD